jgi:hypothetical protein
MEHEVFATIKIYVVDIWVMTPTATEVALSLSEEDTASFFSINV